MEITDVVTAMEELLRANKTSLTTKQLVIRTKASLKKKFGKQKVSHLNNKAEFQKDWFNKAITSEQGKMKFAITDNRQRIDLMERHLKTHRALEKRSGLTIQEVDSVVEEIIRVMNPRSLELLVKELIEKRYRYKMVPDHPASKATNDGGLDFFGTKKDSDDHFKEKLFVAQVKRFTKSKVDRSIADGFYGAVEKATKGTKYTKVMALIVTAGTFTDSFKSAMDDFSKPGMTFIYWDGAKLAEKIVGTGLGMTYAPDVEYWVKLDADLCNKEPLQMKIEQTADNE